MRDTTYYALAAMELAEELLEGGHPTTWHRARRLANLAGVRLEDLIEACR